VKNPLDQFKRLLVKLTRTGAVVRVDTRQRRVALTFDDGPSPEYTPRLLDILDRHGARATFFMVGEVAARYRELVAEVAARGHVIGNHSWSHHSFPTLSRRQRREEIRRCAEMLSPYEQPLFRPPFGHQSLLSRLDPLWAGYEVICWNVLASDWRDLPSEELLKRLTGRVRPGNIILLHDALFTAEREAYLDRTPTLQAVDRLLAGHPDFEFVTVPELMDSGRVVRQPWFRVGDSQWLEGLMRREVSHLGADTQKPP